MLQKVYLVFEAYIHDGFFCCGKYFFSNKILFVMDIYLFLATRYILKFQMLSVQTGFIFKCARHFFRWYT